jgi:hypothetical protein
LSQNASESPIPRGRAIAGASFGVLFLGLLMVVWADPLFTRKNFGGRDLEGYHLPVESAIHDAYARGRWPVWLAEVSGGRPLAANPNAGALYPVRPLLALVPFPIAMRIFPVFHWWIAGLGTFLLLRSVPFSRPAAWVGAVTYVFSGVGVTEALYTNIEPGMALLPWIIWAIARPGGTWSSRTLVLAVLLALDLYAGDVFTTGLAVAGGFLWILIEQDRRSRRREAGGLAVAIVLSGILAAPPLLAAALWVPLTNRAVLGMKVDEVVALSLSPWRLLELAVPFPFGATWALESWGVWGTPVFRERIVGFFSSLYAGGLAAMGAVLLLRTRARGARFALAFLALGLLLSVVPGLVPSTWEGLQSPVALRYPEKFAVAIAAALAIGASLAFEHWRVGARSIRLPLGVGALLAALAGVCALRPAAAGRAAVAAVGAPERLAPIASRQLPESFAEAGLLWIATVVAIDRLRSRGPGSVPVALAILTLVPILANRRIAQTFREEELFAPTAFARFVARKDPEGAYRTLGYAIAPAEARELAGRDPGRLEASRRVWLHYTPALWKRGQVFNGDVDHGDLSRTESLRQVFNHAALYKDSSPFFGALSLRFGLRSRSQTPFSGYHRVGGDALQDWDEHEQPYPDVRLLTRWHESPSARDALAAIPRLSPGEVVLESGRVGAGTARDASARVVERSPERLVVDTQSSDAGWLFVLRGFWDYRDVTVDGRPVEAVPADLAFSAAPVPAGRHRIVWEERLPGLDLSRWGPALFALTAALLLLRERKSAPHPDPHPGGGGAE